MKFKVEMIVQTFDDETWTAKEVADEVKEYMNLATDEDGIGCPTFKKITYVKVKLDE